MTQTSERLLQQALELPEQERADMAVHLFDSLEASTDLDEQEWSAELQQRIGECDQHSDRLIPRAQAERMIFEGHDDDEIP